MIRKSSTSSLNKTTSRGLFHSQLQPKERGTDSIKGLIHGHNFYHKIGCHHYGKLTEEPENSFIKGNDDYPDKLVSSYHMISEYKNWQPWGSTPYSSGVSFVQQAEKEDSWHKEAVFHHWKEKGHICPNCPMFDKNRYNYEEEDKNPPVPNKKATKSSPQNKNTNKNSFSRKHQKNSQPVNQTPPLTMSTRILFSLTLASVWPASLKIIKNLCNILLLDNQSTGNLFWNNKLVSRVW